MRARFHTFPIDRHDLIYSGYASINMSNIYDANSLVARLASGDERRVFMVGTGARVDRYHPDHDYDPTFLDYGNIAVVQHHGPPLGPVVQHGSCIVSIYIAMNPRFDWHAHLRELAFADNGFKLTFMTKGYGSYRFLLTPPRRQLLLKSEATRFDSLLLLITAFSQLPGTIGTELLRFNKRIFSYLPHW